MVVRKLDGSVSIAPVDTPIFAQGEIKVSVKVPRNLCTVNHRVHRKKLPDRTIDSILVGERHFWLFCLAGGPPYILHTYLKYQLYTLCVHTTMHIFGGLPAMS